MSQTFGLFRRKRSWLGGAGLLAVFAAIVVLITADEPGIGVLVAPLLFYGGLALIVISVVFGGTPELDPGVVVVIAVALTVLLAEGLGRASDSDLEVFGAGFLDGVGDTKSPYDCVAGAFYSVARQHRKGLIGLLAHRGSRITNVTYRRELVCDCPYVVQVSAVTLFGMTYRQSERGPCF